MSLSSELESGAEVQLSHQLSNKIVIAGSNENSTLI